MSSVGESQVVDSTPVLILVDHDVQVNEAYYRNVMLLQQCLSTIRPITHEFFIQQDSSQAHAAGG